MSFRREKLKRPRRPSGQLQCWAPTRQIHHPHVAPKYAPAEPRAQSLGAGLLGGEALGVGGGAAYPAIGFQPLRLGEHTGEEALAVALDSAFDPPDVDHVVA